MNSSDFIPSIKMYKRTMRGEVYLPLWFPSGNSDPNFKVNKESGYKVYLNLGERTGRDTREVTELTECSQNNSLLTS